MTPPSWEGTTNTCPKSQWQISVVLQSGWWHINDTTRSSYCTAIKTNGKNNGMHQTIPWLLCQSRTCVPDISKEQDGLSSIHQCKLYQWKQCIQLGSRADGHNYLSENVPLFPKQWCHSQFCQDNKKYHVISIRGRIRGIIHQCTQSSGRTTNPWRNWTPTACHMNSNRQFTSGRQNQQQTPPHGHTFPLAVQQGCPSKAVQVFLEARAHELCWLLVHTPAHHQNIRSEFLTLFKVVMDLRACKIACSTARVC